MKYNQSLNLYSKCLRIIHKKLYNKHNHYIYNKYNQLNKHFNYISSKYIFVIKFFIDHVLKIVK